MSKSNLEAFVSANIKHTGRFGLYLFDRERTETVWEVSITREQAEALHRRLTELLAMTAGVKIGGGE